jgi:hypothetical protein
LINDLKKLAISDIKDDKVRNTFEDEFEKLKSRKAKSTFLSSNRERK